MDVRNLDSSFSSTGNLDMVGAVLGIGVMGVMFTGLIAFILTIVGTIKMSNVPDVAKRPDLIILTVLSWFFMPTPVVNIVLPAILIALSKKALAKQ